MGDIFGDMGIIGAAIIESREEINSNIIHNFVMSCAMGYGMERYMLADIINITTLPNLMGTFNYSSKNAPAESFYRASGFEKTDTDNTWTHNKPSKNFAPPIWINSFADVDVVE